MREAIVTVSRVRPGTFGGAIFSGTVGDETVKVVADHKVLPDPPVPGEVWRVSGEMRTHQKYGPQLHASRATRERLRGAVLVDYLTRNPAFEGVGKKLAQRLWDAFSVDAYRILDAGDLNALRTLYPADLAGSILAAWANQKSETEALEFLHANDCPPRLARRALQYWQCETVAALKDDPYRLLAFLSLKRLDDWKNLDKLARRIGVMETDDRRLLAAVEAVLYRAYDNGHTAVSKAKLLAGLRDFLGFPCGDPIYEHALILSGDRRVLRGSGEDLWQGYGIAKMESYVKARVLEMVEDSERRQGTLFEADFHESLIDRFEHVDGIQLNEEQRAAVAIALTSRFSVITGGAGVGKTTTLKAVYACLDAAGIGIVQMALAGRAAKRMNEATGREAMTVAKFIRRARESVDYLVGSPTVVIDETSMIDLPTFYELLTLIPPGCRMILVGDPLQLPPIGPGLILHRLVESARIPCVELKVVKRACDSTGIPAISTQIRSGSWPALRQYEGMVSGATFITASPDAIQEVIKKIYDELGGPAPESDVQVLGIVKNGASGVKQLNYELHRIYTKGADVIDQGWAFAVGDKVMFTVNDWKRELFNGTLGHLIEVVASKDHGDGDESAKAVAVANFDTGRKELVFSDLESLDFAYAITVHKSQGSEFRRVIIPILPSRLLDLSMIYTAVTRAKEQVVLVGDVEAARNAVEGMTNAHRRVVALRF